MLFITYTSNCLLKIWCIMYNIVIFSISEPLAAPQGTINGSNEQKDEMEEAISWYNTVLGFHVEGGDGNLCCSCCPSFILFNLIDTLVTSYFAMQGWSSPSKILTWSTPKLNVFLPSVMKMMPMHVSSILFCFVYILKKII